MADGRALAPVTQVGDHELDVIAARWRQLSRTGGAQHAALGHEFSLYLLRNPEARERVAGQRRRVLAELTEFVTAGIDKLGVQLSMSTTTFAQLLIATSDAVMLASELDDVDLYRPILQLYTSAVSRTPR